MSKTKQPNVIDFPSHQSEKTMSSTAKTKMGPTKETADYALFSEADAATFMPTSSAGERFDALTKSIQERGQLLPIIVDANHAVLDGRSRLKICQALGIPVRYQVIPHGRDPRETVLDGALHREWTVIEKADFIRSVFDRAKDFGIVSKKEGERRELVGAWLKERMGWSYGTSGKNISNYVKLSKGMETISDEQASKVAAADTLHEALQHLPKQNSKLTPSDTPIADDPRRKVLDQVISEFSLQGGEPVDDEFMKLVREARDLLDQFLQSTAVA